jgi:hypothetical protein
VLRVLALLIAMPAVAAPYGAAAAGRTSPELSDLALFACAVAAIWFVRRRLRARFRARRED